MTRAWFSIIDYWKSTCSSRGIWKTLAKQIIGLCVCVCLVGRKDVQVPLYWCKDARVEWGQGHTLVIEFVIFFSLLWKFFDVLETGSRTNHKRRLGWKPRRKKRKVLIPSDLLSQVSTFFIRSHFRWRLVHLITTANSIRPITFEVVQSVVKVRRNNILHFFFYF